MTHAPKIAALSAYEEQLLSDDGNRRFEGHLADCATCREALASMRVYDDMVASVRADEPPEIDWSRMDLALRREARDQARTVRNESGGGRAMLGAFVLAAAAVLAVFSMGREPVPHVEVHGEAPLAPTSIPAVLTGEVTATVGDLRVEPAASPLAVGDEVPEGMGLATGPDSEAHVRFSDGTGVVLHDETRVHVDELREGRVALGLLEGSVSNEVAPLDEGERYEVRAGPWTVAVRGTRFTVRQRDGEVAVTVSEGVVDVFYLDQLVRRLHAPASWRSGGPTEAREPAQPAGLDVGAIDWPILEVAPLDGVSLWEVHGTTFEAAGTLRMRAPLGEVSVTGWTADQVVLRQVVAVLEEGTRMTPEVQPSAPPVRFGELSADLIAPVVQRGRLRLSRCKERADREGTEVFGRFTLRLTIGRTGAVSRARLVGGDAPRAFVGCVVDQARTWTFPPPTGGIVQVDVPLRFTTARR